jgi:hypothetical protein
VINAGVSGANASASTGCTTRCTCTTDC